MEAAEKKTSKKIQFVQPRVKSFSCLSENLNKCVEIFVYLVAHQPIWLHVRHSPPGTIRIIAARARSSSDSCFGALSGHFSSWWYRRRNWKRWLFFASFCRLHAATLGYFAKRTGSKEEKGFGFFLQNAATRELLRLWYYPRDIWKAISFVKFFYLWFRFHSVSIDKQYFNI